MKSLNTHKSANAVLLLKAGEGRKYNCGKTTAIFKADNDETDMRYSVSEWWMEPNFEGVGKHQHETNEELFYVVKGTVSFFIGDEWVDVKQGAFIRVPSKTTHDFANKTNKKAGLLNVFMPGGFEQKMPSIEQWFKNEKK